MAKIAGDEQKTAQRYSLEKRADGTIEIKVVVPWNEAEKVRENVVDELVKNVEAPGFRKGTVPKNIAEKKLDKNRIQEEVLKKVLTDEYVKAVKELSITPIINPKVHVEAFSEGTDLEFTAVTCEEPHVDLKNYKDRIKSIKSAPKIILPGEQGSEEPGNPSTSSGQRKLDEILNTALNVVEISMPKILIEQEANRLLSQLLDELKRLGVSLDQYLASRGKTDEELRKEYEERAEKDLKLEFMLRKVADEEKITVEQADIEKAIADIKDEEQKKEISQNPYLVASIIRQQKTLDFLSKL